MSSVTLSGISNRPPVNVLPLVRDAMIAQIVDLGECYEIVTQRGMASFTNGALDDFLLWYTDFLGPYHERVERPLVAFWSHPELNGAYIVDLEILSPVDGPMTAQFKLVEAHILFQNMRSQIQQRSMRVASALIERHLLESITYAKEVKELGEQVALRLPTCDITAYARYECCAVHLALDAKQTKVHEMLLVLDALLGFDSTTRGDSQLANYCGIQRPREPRKHRIGSINWWKMLETELNIEVPNILTSLPNFRTSTS